MNWSLSGFYFDRRRWWLTIRKNDIISAFGVDHCHLVWEKSSNNSCAIDDILTIIMPQNSAVMCYCRVTIRGLAFFLIQIPIYVQTNLMSPHCRAWVYAKFLSTTQPGTLRKQTLSAIARIPNGHLPKFIRTRIFSDCLAWNCKKRNGQKIFY